MSTRLQTAPAKKSDSLPVFPSPPRPLARHENRGSAALIAIGLLILMGISVLIPVLKEEQQLAERRKRVWNGGVAVGGVIEAIAHTTQV